MATTPYSPANTPIDFTLAPIDSLESRYAHRDRLTAAIEAEKAAERNRFVNDGTSFLNIPMFLIVAVALFFGSAAAGAAVFFAGKVVPLIVALPPLYAYGIPSLLFVVAVAFLAVRRFATRHVGLAA